MSDADPCYAHNHTLEGYLARAARREPIIDLQGNLICSRDRKPPEGQQLEATYWTAVANAVAYKNNRKDRDTHIPMEVLLAYKERVMKNGIPEDHHAIAFIKDERIPPTMDTPLVNTKGKPFTWAFSAINDFDPEMGGCPKYYGHMRYFFDYKTDDKVDHLVWGNYVHKQLENRLKKKIALPEDMQKWDKWCVLIENHAEKVGGTIVVENQYAIDKNFKPCSWFGQDAWGRGIVDVAIIAGDKCWIFDWKTGKVSENLLQLQIFCLFLAFHYPDIKTFIPRFIFLKFDEVGPKYDLRIQREELLPVMKLLTEKLDRIQEAWKHENFPAMPSGLCGWRPCHKDCASYRGRK